MKTVNEILAKYDYDASVEAYEASQMVQLLKNRETDVLSFLDKYEQ